MENSTKTRKAAAEVWIIKNKAATNKNRSHGRERRKKVIVI